MTLPTLKTYHPARTWLLTIAVLLFAGNSFGQSYGATTGTNLDQFVINNDLSNHWSALRLQTSNNRGWTLFNEGSLSFYFSGANDITTSGTKLMSITYDGRLRVGRAVYDPNQTNVNVTNVLELNAVGQYPALSFYRQGDFTFYLKAVGLYNQPRFLHITGPTNELTPGLLVDGKVGVGTTSPTESLDVIGNIKGSGNITAMGNVGIGTASPFGALDVNGKVLWLGKGNRVNGSWGDYPGLKLTSAASDLSSGINFMQDGKYNFLLYPVTRTDNSVALHLSTYTNSSGGYLYGIPDLVLTGKMGIGNPNPTESLDVIGNIKASGNIGIGVTSPKQKLDVAGNINVSGSGSKFNLSNSATWDNINLSHDGTTAKIAAGGADNGIAFLLNTAGTGDGFTQVYTEAMRILPTGKVGIGKVNPLEALDVTGNIKASGNIITAGTVTANEIITQKLTYVTNAQTTGDFTVPGTLTANKIVSNGSVVGSSLTTTGNILGQTANIGILTSNSINTGTLNATGNLLLTTPGSKVGIGTSTPVETLDVAGSVKATSYKFSDSNVKVGTTGTAASASVFIGNNAGIDFTNTHWEGNSNPLSANKSVFVVNNQAQLGNPLLFGTFADNADKNSATSASTSMAQLAINTHHLVKNCALTVSGAIHVGPKDLDPESFAVTDSLYEGYLLWVQKGIVSEDYAISKVENWSDFVFDASYALPSLYDVELYINQHHHLKDLPSEQEVKANGYRLHEINTALLQKVEELTLYTIQQQKELDAQRNSLKSLEEEMNQLRALIANLKK